MGKNTVSGGCGGSHSYKCLIYGSITAVSAVFSFMLVFKP